MAQNFSAANPASGSVQRALAPEEPARISPAIHNKSLPQEALPVKNRGLLLCRLDLGVLAAEALHAAGRVHQLLLAGEKRVAV